MDPYVIVSFNETFVILPPSVSLNSFFYQIIIINLNKFKSILEVAGFTVIVFALLLIIIPCKVVFWNRGANKYIHDTQLQQIDFS
jgi:hypothetical protein